MQHANAVVEVFVGGYKGDLTTWADAVRSVRAQLKWLPANQRDLTIVAQLKGQSAASVTSTITLVGTDGNPMPGRAGVLLPDANGLPGAVGIVQSLRLIVTAVDAGLRCRAYVNQDDDDHPTHEVVVPHDWIDPDTTTQFGYAGFAFGAAGTNDALSVSHFRFEDYAVADRVAVVVEPNQVTLAELREQVRRRVAGSGQTNYDPWLIDDALRDSVRSILNAIGDANPYTVRSESFTLEPDDNGFVTLSPKIRRPHRIEEVTSTAETPWSLDSHDSTGAIVIRLYGHSATYRVYYLPHIEEMSEDTDVCPLPREHSECVVMGACERLVESDFNVELQAAYKVRHLELLQILRRDANRDGDMARQRFRPKRIAQGRYGRHGLYWPYH